MNSFLVAIPFEKPDTDLANSEHQRQFKEKLQINELTNATQQTLNSATSIASRLHRQYSNSMDAYSPESPPSTAIELQHQQ